MDSNERRGEREDISVVIPWSNRAELGTTLRENCRFVDAIGAEVVVVNCGGDGDLLRSLLPADRGARVRVVSVEGVAFSRGLALNLGAHYAGGDTLFMMDADVIFQDDRILRLAGQLGSGHYATVAEVVESEDSATNPVAAILDGKGPLAGVVRSFATEYLWTDGSRTTIRNARVSADGRFRAGPGLILVRKGHFYGVGGYNSEMSTWGYEDLDLQVRLQRVLGLTPLEDGRMLHLSHGDEVRRLGGLTKGISNGQNFLIACEAYARGCLQGTLSSDVASLAARTELC